MLHCCGNAVAFAKDVPIEIKQVLNVWRARKLSHEQCIKDVVLTRARGAAATVDHVNYIMNQECEQKEAAEEEELTRLLSKHMKAFITHPIVEQWRSQYVPANYGKLFRFKILLLRGWSRAGKTMFAKHIFGEDRTVIVNCQGLGDHLPSLRAFMRCDHKAIVFDEVQVGQVLKNKAIFQAGPIRVEMSQSPCGGFRYSKWLYQVAMICCSNDFPMTRAEGLKCDEDVDWITNNVMCVQLNKHASWYIQDTPEIKWSKHGA